ncbi:MAG: methionine adenosyltransferase [Fimbriimonadaceae bacterium]|nr:methionine adenosyltransferase [Fimbriimonadaceae bacterium]QYK59623.1 MAG: methionine adenosyltransferase [Fimbriimonadaceae bacterium]
MLHIHTSESVSEGHPDKVADQISDSLLDEFLAQDLQARVAVETMLAHGVAIVSGEVTTEGYVNVQQVVRETIKSIGYTDTRVGFDGNSCGVLVAIQGQSPDIAMGVDTGGAGDQGMMFGMASTETEELMPLPISIAHALMRRAAELRHSDPSLGLRPDAKSQVSVIYESGRPKAIDCIVVSHQHDERLSQGDVHDLIETKIVDPVLTAYSPYVDGPITYHFNPTGRFVIGGPAGDTGLTGRKIIVDTYGGMCPHGGGAFSGKDPTKVDRSAAYMARHVAKTVVAAGLADKCQVALAYAIGVAQPVSVNIETFGTEKDVSVEKIAERVREVFDLSPRGIMSHLGLRSGRGLRYRETARNGHFGNRDFPWEQTTQVEAFQGLLAGA